MKTPFNQKKSIISLISFIALILGSLIGLGFSVWSVLDNYKLNGQYEDSYNMRFELDTTPYKEGSKYQKTEAELREMLVDSGDAYSSWLTSLGINEYSVFPEFKTEEITNPEGVLETQFHAYLSVNVPNATYLDEGDDGVETKKDEPATNIYFQYLRSSRTTMVLSEYNGATSKYISTTFPFEFINKDKITSENKDGYYYLYIPLNESVQDTIIKAFEEQTDNLSYVYIFKDQDFIINYLNYLLALESAYSIDPFETDPMAAAATEARKRLPQPEKDWAKSYSGPVVSEENLISVIDRDGNNGGPNGSIDEDVSFLSEYLLAVVNGPSGEPVEEGEEEDKGNYEEYFPSTNPMKDDADTNYQLLVLPQYSPSDANRNLKGMQEQALDLPLKLMPLGENLTEEDGLKFFTSVSSNMNRIDPVLSNSIVGVSAIIGTLIALGIIILIIGLVVSILYRIPGLVGFVCLLLPPALTLLILTISGYSLSLTIFMAILVGIFMSTFCLINILGRFRKRVKNNEDLDAAMVRTWKKGFFTLFDFHIVLVIIGLCFVYFSSLGLIQFGITLTIYTLFSFAFCVGIFFVLNLLFTTMKYKIPLSCYLPNWDFKKRLGSELTSQKMTCNVTGFESTFTSNRTFKKFNIFNKYFWIVLGGLAVFITAGLALGFGLGFANAFEFSNGTRLVIYDPNQLIAVDVLTKSLGGSWYNINWSNGYLYMTTASIWENNPTITAELVDKIIAAGYSGFTAASLHLETVSSAQNVDYAAAGAIVLSAATGFICLYSLLRLNWISIVPALIGLVISPALLLAFFGLFRIYIDVNIVLAVTTVYVINALLTINIIGNINSKWDRYRIYKDEQIKEIFNLELVNANHYWMIICSLLLASVAVLMVFFSQTLIWFCLAILVGFVITGLMIWYIVPYFLYLFLKLRIKYLQAVDNNQDKQTKKNYDNFDEQLIEGINKFSKRGIQK